jgi:D-lactate dehydrogenase
VPYLTLQNAERHKHLKLIDSVGWAHDYLLPKLKVLGRVGSVAIHSVCFVHHLGLVEKLQALGNAWPIKL